MQDLTNLYQSLDHTNREIAAAQAEAAQPHTEIEHVGILLWEMDWHSNREMLLEEIALATMEQGCAGCQIKARQLREKVMAAFAIVWITLFFLVTGCRSAFSTFRNLCLRYPIGLTVATTSLSALCLWLVWDGLHADGLTIHYPAPAIPLHFSLFDVLAPLVSIALFPLLIYCVYVVLPRRLREDQKPGGCGE